ncbi:MAG: hypothetical protein FWB91_05870, partial [Defluviitaleaceae bacterium]|nr:hypothetical protein [Defluviitaleaceae bacterium]
MKRAIILVLLTAILLVSGCSGRQAGHGVWFDSYRDIPGVTEEHIQAIAQLREQHEYFIYGMLQNDETLYTLDGEIVGFTAQICDWLTELFGIPFVPVIFEELTDLMAGL